MKKKKTNTPLFVAEFFKLLPKERHIVHSGAYACTFPSNYTATECRITLPLVGMHHAVSPGTIH